MDKSIRIVTKTSQVNNHLEPELVYQESNKYIYLYDGDKYTIYSPNQVTAEKRIKEKIKKGVWNMNIYQLKLRSHYIEKSFENENFKDTLFQAMSPRTDIFLIDEYFNPVSVINKGSHYLKVHIYKINKDYTE